ncbi:MAG TPA: AbrB/MazE/SpoVT family DNA-binding domain-containing protein [Candidatus Paceibacterota bacterium]|jgi:putative addiction module antidote|nr:AbrB/MazE/SpoVT family DNA-binding domain-containing protein [Candidatus Paceibacterota bacterium]
MIQKVLKVGSSAAVTIPKKSLEELGVKIGDSVLVSVHDKKVTIEARTISQSVVDTDTVAWAKSFIEAYRPALEALKDK